MALPAAWPHPEGRRAAGGPGLTYMRPPGSSGSLGASTPPPGSPPGKPSGLGMSPGGCTSGWGASSPGWASGLGQSTSGFGSSLGSMTLSSSHFRAFPEIGDSEHEIRCPTSCRQHTSGVLGRPTNAGHALRRRPFQRHGFLETLQFFEGHRPQDGGGADLKRRGVALAAAAAAALVKPAD